MKKLFVIFFIVLISSCNVTSYTRYFNNDIFYSRPYQYPLYYPPYYYNRYTPYRPYYFEPRIYTIPKTNNSNAPIRKFGQKK